MKTHCPFCQKQLSRVEKLKYHIEHSVCSSNEEERNEVLLLLNMDVGSTLEYMLQLRRKTYEITQLKDDITQLKDKNLRLTDENLVLRRNNDALTEKRNGEGKQEKSIHNNNDDHSTHRPPNKYKHHNQ